MDPCLEASLGLNVGWRLVSIVGWATIYGTLGLNFRPDFPSPSKSASTIGYNQSFHVEFFLRIPWAYFNSPCFLAATKGVSNWQFPSLICYNDFPSHLAVLGVLQDNCIWFGALNTSRNYLTMTTIRRGWWPSPPRWPPSTLWPWPSTPLWWCFVTTSYPQFIWSPTSANVRILILIPWLAPSLGSVPCPSDQKIFPWRSWICP